VERGTRFVSTLGEVSDTNNSCFNANCFITTRSPDDAKIKQKMLFASSRDALRRSLVGIAAEIQGTDYSEVAYESGQSRLLRCILSPDADHTCAVLDKVSRGF
jgi:hypothetical protein